MAVIRIHLEAESVVSGTITITTVTNIVPTVRRYTATVVLGNILGGTTTIPATSFTGDNGAAIPAGGLTVPTSSGYYNVFVNGALQRSGLTTLSTTSLIIGTALLVGANIVVEVVNFTSSATSTSTNDIAVTTTITD
ncbi:hypothetical protein PAECIP111893_04224 [Paenibacillus plantiphilus]|uniref:DUF4183 domain-containing protein n=1 Tax=Paenibacillus plantiphilus TaxID=2905650 RepID=A0ABM9CMG5_9BACL|nr:DUF4183 domain-containing protein [Paenibacillus plantiphilus]CAH1216996.1 hypothetical protein PAECIP111893_04224 [Paenibacillus plantiphilus]